MRTQALCSNFWAQAAMLAAFLVSVGGGPQGASAKSAKAVPFPVASVHFEQNATDGDVEVVFDAKGKDDGLASLKVVSPDGRTVIDFAAPDASTLGIRQFRFESPEPKNVDALKAAYPEGRYAFSGKTVSGAALAGTSVLSHRLPKVAQFGTPAPNAGNIPTKDAKISWRPVPGVVSYIVEIEHDALKTRVEATLPHSSTTFAVPDGFLMSGKEYKLSIGTLTEAGNISFVETSFRTKK